MSTNRRLPTSVLPLHGRVRHYSWGKIGADSLVYRLAAAEEREEGKPHAELWLGTHPSAPATIPAESKKSPNNSLRDIVTLPFLLKVLSIGAPLSIQLHPAKTLAQTLHRQDPKNYPDGDAKPEMVFALTKFTALHDFRARVEIDAEAEAVGVVRELFPRLENTSDVAALQIWFERVCSLSPGEVANYVSRLTEAYRQRSASDLRVEWYHRIVSTSSVADRGLLFFSMLQLKTLACGETLFTQPGIVHAYLEGDVVECMATSDNVIRLGLTEKFVDLAAACKAVCYAGADPKLLEAIRHREGVVTYRFSAGGEFNLTVFSGDPGQLKTGLKTVTLPINHHPALLLSINAQGQLAMDSGGVCALTPGAGFYLPAATSPYLLSLSAGVVVVAH